MMRCASTVILLLVLLAVAACDSSSSRAEPATQALRLEARIPLGQVTGRIDHMAIDLPRHRVFVAELGNNSIGVVEPVSAMRTSG